MLALIHAPVASHIPTGLSSRAPDIDVSIAKLVRAVGEWYYALVFHSFCFFSFEQALPFKESSRISFMVEMACDDFRFCTCMSLL